MPLMTDKNNVLMTTGCIIRTQGCYFKTDNATYLITHSPGDPGWLGDSYGLIKMNPKQGCLSKAKHNIGFWPPLITTNSARERRIAASYNDGHATAEVIELPKARDAVREYFQGQADEVLEFAVNFCERNFGSDNADTIAQKEIEVFLRGISEKFKEEAQ